MPKHVCIEYSTEKFAQYRKGRSLVRISMSFRPSSDLPRCSLTLFSKSRVSNSRRVGRWDHVDISRATVVLALGVLWCWAAIGTRG
ncbi:hypothetical protein BDN70DRAFT_887660 [Pholiota conissans]|uniref:Uncharacterized protein n=1 Tax=Pholiota conissans TaxID=109636 RepID=A0A9P5YMV5_9AGAR|nr:hypothetical protein BDN70DRAFT_887660 [Pholiota conissans]